MLKNNKLTAIIASFVTLSPIAAGLILWDRLPEQIAVHWGPTGEADGFSGKAGAVFVMPLVLFALFWICVLASTLDKKNAEQSDKAKTLVLYLVPYISLLVNGIVYATALGLKFSVIAVMAVAFGILFSVIGNYLPKCKQNHTIGIRIKWTLESEENWNATHRLAGKLWFFGGFAVAMCALLPETLCAVCFSVMMLVLAFSPMIYSYTYYRKEKKNESN